jgi:glycosyltransferase involved in cell wall biosynthesis
LFDPSSCRILFVVGGASLWRKMNTGNEDLAWALAEAGIEVHILAGGMRPEEHSYKVPPRVFYHFTEKAPGKAEPGDHVDLYKELTQRFNFDFVIGWLLYLEPLLRSRSIRAGGPIFIANEGYLSNDRRPIRSKLKHSVAALLGHKFTRARGRGPISAWKGLASVGPFVDFAVPISKTVMRNCQEFYGIPADKCRVIYGGVDLSVFAPDPRIDRRELKNPPRLIFTGNIIASKGVMDVVDALQFVDTPVDLVLCGRDLDQMVQEVGPRLEASKKGHRFIYKGSLGHEALAAELKLADIFVFCSWTEGLGKSLLEAMACGLPVVVSNIDAFREFVVDGQNGLVVPVKDPHSIAEAIKRFFNNPDLRDKCGKGASKTVQDFNIRNEAKAWIGLFADLKISEPHVTCTSNQSVKVEV